MRLKKHGEKQKAGEHGRAVREKKNGARQIPLAGPGFSRARLIPGGLLASSARFRFSPATA